MKDYRQPSLRREYFTKLYQLNLEQKVMPGLVYLYLPALKHHFGWGTETALWFAFLNGMTQNPLTSLRLFEQLPMYPSKPIDLLKFEIWFNENWASLQFDTDRRYAKKDTVAAIISYRECLTGHNGQEAMLTGKTFPELWKLVNDNYFTFGRLSSWSYLEYVKIMLGDRGVDATTLFFEEKDGSRSHRNGMLMLLGDDALVHDKRLPNGFDGKYQDLSQLARGLQLEAEHFLKFFPPHPDAGMLTLESNLCTFKNHFFGRRYPGVYADMAWERILWYEKNVGPDQNTDLVRGIRGQLPLWLRAEDQRQPYTMPEKGDFFAKHGFPYRGEHFL